MLVTFTSILNDVGPATVALGAGTIRRIRFLALTPLTGVTAGFRHITVTNVRVNSDTSGATATLCFSSEAVSAGIIRTFLANDGLDMAPDQPSTITFITGANSGTYTCIVGYDKGA